MIALLPILSEWKCTYLLLFRTSIFILITNISQQRANVYLSVHAISEKQAKVSQASKCISSVISEWQAVYNNSLVDQSTLSKEVKNLMENYDHKTQAEKEAAGKQEADNDGWVTVTTTLVFLLYI